VEIGSSRIWECLAGGGDDLAVGDYNDAVGGELLKQIACFGGSVFFLVDARGTCCDSGVFHWGGGEVLASAAGAVGLGDHGGRFRCRVGRRR